jgi:prolyl-tRNA editing enzyme YbaK/EbsC (Cys-tRNA(Pro) deacylase)
LASALLDLPCWTAAVQTGVVGAPQELAVGQQQAQSGEKQANFATQQAWTRAFQYQRHYVDVTAAQRERRHASELAADTAALQEMQEQLASRDDRVQQLTLELDALDALNSQHVAAAQIQRGYHRYCSKKDSRELIRAHAIHSTGRIDELTRREFQINRLEAQLAARHESLEDQAQYTCESSPVEQDELIATLTAELEEMQEQHKAAVAAADRGAETQKAQTQQAIEAAIAEVSPSFAPTR